VEPGALELSGSLKTIIMSKHSLEEDLKPKSVFVEDAEAAQADLGSYSRNINARYDQVTLIAEEYV
jgi:hypothetical protein